MDPEQPRQDHIEECVGERRQKQTRCVASQEIHPKDLQGKEPEYEQAIRQELSALWRTVLLVRKKNVAKEKADDIAGTGTQRRAVELFQKLAPARQRSYSSLVRGTKSGCFPRRFVPPWWSVLCA
jgi:hypothetical protein